MAGLGLGSGPGGGVSAAGLISQGYIPESAVRLGAVGDAGVTTGGAITAASDELTVGSTTGMVVGQSIDIPGAGAAGAVLGTTIVSVDSSTLVTVADAASTTVSGQAVSFGTDDTDAIQAFLTACSGRMGFIPAGRYRIRTNLALPATFEIVAEKGAIFDGVDNTLDITHSGITQASIDGLRITRFRRALDGQTNWTRRFRFTNNEVDSCSEGLRCPGPAEHVYISHNYIHDLSAAGELTAIQFGESAVTALADQPNNIAEYNHIENIENTAGSDSDVHAILLRGLDCKVLYNHIANVNSGGVIGCEGIYCVGVGVKIMYNYLENAGTWREGVITTKGENVPGRVVTIAYNHLVTTRSNVRGITTYVDDTQIIGNIFEGFPLSQQGIGGQSLPERVVVDANWFIGTAFNIGIKAHAKDWIVRNNLFIYPDSAGALDYGIFTGDVSEAHDNLQITGNSFVLDSTLTSTEFQCIAVSAATFKVGRLFCDANSLYNKSYAATLRFYTFLGSASNSLESSRVRFAGRVEGSVTEVLRRTGGAWPSELEIDIRDGAKVKTASLSLTLAWHHHGGDYYLITNQGSSATRAHLLKPASPGMKIKFIRTGTGAVRLDPDGTEVIGTGGAGKYLEITDAGGSVTLECVVAGRWEITQQVGAVSYEA